MKNQMQTGGNKKQQTAKITDSSLLFIISCITSTGSYVYTLIRGNSFNEMFYAGEQKINQYYLAGILIAAPALFGVCAVLYKAVKKGYAANMFKAVLITSLLLLLLSGNNYYGIWIPFFVISLFLTLFYSIWQNNPAVLDATREIGDYLSEHRFYFFIVLIVMASFSNVSSSYLSNFFQDIFSILPY